VSTAVACAALGLGASKPCSVSCCADPKPSVVECGRSGCHCCSDGVWKLGNSGPTLSTEVACAALGLGASKPCSVACCADPKPSAVECGRSGCHCCSDGVWKLGNSGPTLSTEVACAALGLGASKPCTKCTCGEPCKMGGIMGTCQTDEKTCAVNIVPPDCDAYATTFICSLHVDCFECMTADDGCAWASNYGCFYIQEENRSMTGSESCPMGQNYNKDYFWYKDFCLRSYADFNSRQYGVHKVCDCTMGEGTRSLFGGRNCEPLPPSNNISCKTMMGVLDHYNEPAQCTDFPGCTWKANTKKCQKTINWELPYN